MKTIRSRLVVALAGILIAGLATATIVIGGIERLRSELRLAQSEHSQMRSYFELHTSLRELHTEHRRILEDGGTASTLDVPALRQGIDELLLSLRAEIEREDIETGGLYRLPGLDGGEQASERERLLSLTREIQATLAMTEAADAHLRAGRTTEALEVLNEAFAIGLEERLDSIIAQAIDAEEEEMRVIAATALSYVNLVERSAIVFLVVLPTILAATVAAVALPCVRAIAFLQVQADKLALGGRVDLASSAGLRDVAAVQDGIVRAASAQARLRDELGACQARFSEHTEALREEQNALRRVDQVRRDFLADISHELRTPLTLLRGVAEVALRTNTNAPNEIKAALARMVDETARVTRIVDDLFFIARSQAGALDLRTDIVDLAALSKAAAREADALAVRARGRITWRDASAPVEVEGDEGRLRQLYTILVDNAFKYGGRKPVVEVEHTVSGETIIIDIRDHGPGVPEEDLPYVFDRLFRGARSTAAEPGGSGLGLPLARSIVEGHRGEITLSNAEGGGALARVSLPIFDADALEAASS